jgi:hypothetical protein
MIAVSARPIIKSVNLKHDMPLVREALARVEKEVIAAQREAVRLIKFVHGYGSTGRGGEIRIAVQNLLVQRLERGELHAVIFGENWRIADESTWALIQQWPELKKDSDLGRENRGITVVVI